MPTYTRWGGTIRGEASDVKTSEQRKIGRQARPCGPVRTQVVVWLAVLLIVVSGCSAPEEKLPPRKARERAGSGTGAGASQAGSQADVVPDPQPLPPEVPARPVFEPVGLTDAAKLKARLRDECFEVAETLLADFPADPAGWTLLGAVHRYFGDDAGADKLWNQALVLAPEFPDAHRQLGDAAVE